MNTDRLATLHGIIAVTAFAATLPLTRVALEGFPPPPLTFGRLLGATLLGEPIPAELWLYAAAVVVTIHLARNPPVLPTPIKETRP